MEELSDAQIAELKAALQTKQESLKDLLNLSRERAGTVQLDQTVQGRVSRIDAIQQQEMARANQSQYENELRLVIAALRKIEEDDYGYCARCDEPIGLGRLTIRPETPLCVNCQSHSENP